MQRYISWFCGRVSAHTCFLFQVLSARLGGARVLIPDIYKGKIGVDAEEAHHLMSNLDFPGAVKEILEAAVRAGSCYVRLTRWLAPHECNVRRRS